MLAAHSALSLRWQRLHYHFFVTLLFQLAPRKREQNIQKSYIRRAIQLATIYTQTYTCM